MILFWLWCRQYWVWEPRRQFFIMPFAVIATNMYGDIFVEFETLGSSLLMTLETFGIGGWMTPAAARVMDIFPHAWIFFGIQSVVAFLLVVSFVAAAVAETG